MAVSDDDGPAERLAQVRAQRRHVGRLRTGERQHAGHEGAAAAAAQGEAELAAGQDPLGTPPAAAADTRTLLIAEEAALELDRAGLAADRDTGNDVGVEMDI
jgi:hypothetical protein